MAVDRATRRPSSSSPVATPVVPSADENLPRITLTLTGPPDAGGRIDWDKIRESRRPHLERLLANDPRVRSLVSPAIGTTVPVDDPANRQVAAVILDTIAKLTAAIATRTYGVPIDEAVQLCAYTPVEHATLDPVAGRLVGKHLGSLTAKYGDELALGLMLVTMGQAKIAQVAAAAAKPAPATVHEFVKPSTENL